MDKDDESMPDLRNGLCQSRHEEHAWTGHPANPIAMTLSAYGNLNNPNHFHYISESGKPGQQLDTRSAITSVCVSEVPLFGKQ